MRPRNPSRSDNWEALRRMTLPRGIAVIMERRTPSLQRLSYDENTTELRVLFEIATAGEGVYVELYDRSASVIANTLSLSRLRGTLARDEETEPPLAVVD